MSLPFLRPVLRWSATPLLLSSPLIKMRTAISVEQELWLLLKSYSEVKARGVALLSRYSCPSNLRPTAWKRFRSFIRQAENYWLAAKKTNYKSSSLLYYYSFLNLVKAYLVLNNPRLNLKILHGLSYNTDTPTYGIIDKFVSVSAQKRQNQAFTLYYQTVFNNNPPRFLKIVDLLGHISDIGFQYIESKLGSRKHFAGIHRIAFNESNAWVVIALNGKPNLRYYNKAFKSFLEDFEQAQEPEIWNTSYSELFGMDASEKVNYNFYQTKSSILSENIQSIGTVLSIKLEEMLAGRIERNYYADNHTFHLHLPKNRTETYFMNEEIAIYTVMFFMSELVRYRPDYIDEIFDSKAAWLLESFVESCTLKFLRAISSRITMQTILLSNV